MFNVTVDAIKSIFGRKTEPKEFKFNKRWSEDEESALVQMINDGLCYDDISVAIGRTPNAVYQKTRKLFRDGEIK